MAYTGGVFYLDPVSGVDTARTALTACTASNPSGSITNINKTAHGLVTGAVVDLTLFTAWLNSAWKITVTDANNFTLDGATWQATADASGTVTPRGGSSKTDAWLTFATGVTAARHQPGDTIRIIASPEPTLVGNATWTSNSKTVTLAGAVTATIDNCETAWTASANVTSTADTAEFKENTKSAKHVIAAGFTTGKAAYFATGTLNLSGYQQVSFWLRLTAALAASTLSLRLCSDTAGVTTVNTIAIPSCAAINGWVPVTVDTGGALGASIQSIALYADLDPGTQTVWLDNIIACKASSSDDALTHNSLIGKVWNLSWAASTSYATDDIRIPTSPNRTGLRYKVTAGGGGSSGGSEPTWPSVPGATVADGALTWTCEGLEDTWYAIQSIVGTTVLLDANSQAEGNSTNTYEGATETVATYKREPLVQPHALPTNTFNSVSQNFLTDSGTATSFITYSGGWNRTDMTTQTGQTWITGKVGRGSAIALGTSAYIAIRNFNAVRFSTGVLNAANSGAAQIARDCHFNNCESDGVSYSTTCGGLVLRGIVANNNASSGINTTGAASVDGFACTANGNGGFSPGNGFYLSYHPTNINYAVAKGNAAGAIQASSSLGRIIASFRNLTTANNGGSIVASYGGLTLVNPSFSEGSPLATPFQGQNYNYVQKYDGTADLHFIIAFGGSIVTATDQRNTASGISWKFRPTSTERNEYQPLLLSVAKVAFTASQSRTISIYVRRDSTNIKGKLIVRGGQLDGVFADVEVACEPSVNTWTQYSLAAITPTEAGVIEVEFHCWDGVGTTNNLWIDDLSVS